MPKPGVQLLLTSPTLLAPGDHVTVTLVVDIYEKPFALTGIYVELVGKEYSYIVVHAGNTTYTVPFHFNHVSLHRTVYGASKKSGKHGGAQLEPGHYEYPIDIELPFSAPPTYATVAENGGSRVVYKVRGVLSVPLRRSVRVRMPLTVLSIASFEQAHEGAVTLPREVPLMKNLGMHVSKSEFVTMTVQLWPCVIAAGGRTAKLYYEAQRAAAAHDGVAVVMGKSLGAQEGSSDEDDDFAKQHQLEKKAKKLGEDDEGMQVGVVDELSGGSQGEKDPDPKSALPGKLVRLYQNQEDMHYPFQPSTNAPEVVCARIILQNNTRKEKIKNFEVCLRQVRRVDIGSYHAKDQVSLSKVLVVLPKEKPCMPGDRVALDVELPLRRELLYDPRPLTYIVYPKSLRRRPCVTLNTRAFSCEMGIQLKFPKNSINKKMAAFHGCVQVVELTGAPGAPCVAVPISHTTTHELPEEELHYTEGTGASLFPMK